MLVKGNLRGFAVYMSVYVIIFVSHRQTNKRSVFLLYWCHLFYLTKSLKLLVWDLGSSLLVHFSKSLVCWQESVPSMCSLETSPEVHKQVWDCFPRVWSLRFLPSTFWIPQTPLQGPLSRQLAGAFFVLLCCTLLQLDLHPEPSERRTEGKKMQWRLTPRSQNHSFSERGRRFFLLGNFVFCELPLLTTTTSLQHNYMRSWHERTGKEREKEGRDFHIPNCLLNISHFQRQGELDLCELLATSRCPVHSVEAPAQAPGKTGRRQGGKTGKFITSLVVPQIWGFSIRPGSTYFSEPSQLLGWGSGVVLCSDSRESPL